MRTQTLRLEVLEDRSVPALTSAYTVTNLVSDQAGVAQLQDPNLVNGWGIALNPMGVFWVSSNGKDVSTLYTGEVNGSPLAINPLVVQIPGGAPTGQVFNDTSDFVVSDGTNSGPAAFIFASESGQITGWNPAVPPPAPSTQAQPAATVAGAIFKGLAIGNNGTGNFLYAADFHNNKIDVFDGNFMQTTLAGSFTDPDLPAGFAPFNIQNINGQLYVTYAMQDANAEDDVAGEGLGFVDIFDLNGNFVKRLVSQGDLNAPWGLAVAPTSFGQFGGDLLVGNFGDGRIHAYNPDTGEELGTLSDGTGKPLEIDGLWGMVFGNGTTVGDANTLYFAAGPDDESHGLFGKVTTSTPLFAVGQGTGGSPTVNVYNGLDGSLAMSFQAYDSTFTGGVRVATGDLNGDGIPDIVTAAGTGGGPNVKVFDGSTGAEIASFFAYVPTFTGGVNVAVGDVNGDGVNDIVTGAGPGGGPHVKVLDGTKLGQVDGQGQIDDSALLASFFAYAPTFTGGVSVAAADLNGDGKADVITGAGQGGGPHVKAFSGADNSMLASFFAYAPTFTGGVRVASVDFGGDGQADIVTGAGPTGGPHVKVFHGTDLTELASFFAFEPTFTGGVYVG